MKTLILPGYSRRNKRWALELRDDMNLPHDVLIAEWDHWKIGGDFNLKKELEKTENLFGKDKVNIIAKSVGVFVAYHLIPRVNKYVDKVILSGTAGAAKKENRGMVKDIVEKIGVENIYCYQNENDNYLKYEDAKKFYRSISPEIKVIKMPRSDHHYPYGKEFREFLLN